MSAITVPHPARQWWDQLFNKRQAKLTILILRDLKRWDKPLSTTQVYQNVSRYERVEVEYCLATLAEEGLVTCTEAIERYPNSGGPKRVVYWRAAK